MCDRVRFNVWCSSSSSFLLLHIMICLFCRLALWRWLHHKNLSVASEWTGQRHLTEKLRGMSSVPFSTSENLWHRHQTWQVTANQMKWNHHCRSRYYVTFHHAAGATVCGKTDLYHLLHFALDCHNKRSKHLTIVKCWSSCPWQSCRPPFHAHDQRFRWRCKVKSTINY